MLLATPYLTGLPEDQRTPVEVLLFEIIQVRQLNVEIAILGVRKPKL